MYTRCPHFEDEDKYMLLYELGDRVEFRICDTCNQVSLLIGEIIYTDGSKTKPSRRILLKDGSYEGR